MSLALYEYPAEPSTGQVLGSAASARDLYYGAPSRMDVELTIDPSATPPPEHFSASYAASPQMLREPGARTRIEAGVTRELARSITAHVERTMSAMRGFHEAAMRANAQLQSFQNLLVQTLMERSRRSHWSREEWIGGEVHHQRASLDPAIYAWAAYQHNLGNRHHRESYYYHQYANNWVANTWVANTTPMAEYWYQQPQWLGTDWGMTGTGAQVVSVQMNYFTSSTGNYTAFDVGVPACSCGTCDDCVAAAYQRLENQRRDELARRRAAKRAREHALAERRGRKLLLSLLTEEQQREYARTRCFKVEAADGRTFRLRKGKTAELLGTDGVVDASYCIHLSSGKDEDGVFRSYVAEDTLICQMLLLQTDVEEFERVANITRHRRSAQPDRTAVGIARRDYHRQRALHYLSEYDEAAEAMLRAEGIERPREWVEQLRQQVRDRYRRGDQWTPREPRELRQEIALAVIEDEMHAVDWLAESAVA